MSNLRFEFYQAVNKANIYQPKPKPTKKVVKETISVEEQIANLLKESESAVYVEEPVFDNQKF